MYLMYVNDFSYVTSYVFILLLKIFIPEHGIVYVTVSVKTLDVRVFYSIT